MIRQFWIALVLGIIIGIFVATIAEAKNSDPVNYFVWSNSIVSDPFISCDTDCSINVLNIFTQDTFVTFVRVQADTSILDTILTDTNISFCTNTQYITKLDLLAGF